MATGLLALLDDVAALVKVSAASLDDVPAQVSKTTGKVSGIVIDDAAVTPKYVLGLSPSRELAIIFNIAKKSLVNKLIILAPAALLLGYIAPWLITPILMLGGAYLCFEGYEKVHGMFVKHEDEEVANAEAITPEELEKIRTASAVRTDMILSAEIIAIAYAGVATNPFVTQVVVLATVAVVITIGVYGFVGLIVKADDIGLHFAQDRYSRPVRKIGRGLVLFMPHFLKLLGYVGTAAMLWVGAEIIAHGIPPVHHALEELQHMLPEIPALQWAVKAFACAICGIILGAVVEKLVKLVRKFI